MDAFRHTGYKLRRIIEGTNSLGDKWMPIDRQRLEFGANAILAAEQAGGTLGITGSRAFADRLYAEWQATAKPPSQAVAWLEQRLKNAFVSVGDPPTWVHEEGAWQYHGDQPMVFVSQTDVGVSKPGSEPLSPNEVVYLFGIREPVDGGYRMVYKTVSQHRGFSGVTDE